MSKETKKGIVSDELKEQVRMFLKRPEWLAEMKLLNAIEVEVRFVFMGRAQVAFQEESGQEIEEDDFVDLWLEKLWED